MTLEKEFEVCIKFELLEKKRKFYQTVVMMGSVHKAYMLGIIAIKMYKQGNTYKFISNSKEQKYLYQRLE